MGASRVNLRDDTESVLRAWNAYEIARGADPVVDFDCLPAEHSVTPAASRPQVAQSLSVLRRDAERIGDNALTARLDAHLAYVRSAMGERPGIREYIQVTQGCSAGGWSPEYVESHR